MEVFFYYFFFLQEIAFLSQCRSLYITDYYGSLLYQTKLWIVMEYMAGGSVADLVSSTLQFTVLFTTQAIMCEFFILLMEVRKTFNQVEIHIIHFFNSVMNLCYSFRMPVFLSSNIGKLYFMCSICFELKIESITESFSKFSAIETCVKRQQISEYWSHHLGIFIIILVFCSFKLAPLWMKCLLHVFCVTCCMQLSICTMKERFTGI